MGEIKTLLPRQPEKSSASREFLLSHIRRLMIHYWQPDRPKEHWKMIFEDYEQNRKRRIKG